MPDSPHIALISLSRRGGMVHYLVELANAFASITETSVLTPRSVDADFFSSSVNLRAVNTGKGFKGTLARSINPFFFINLYRRLKSVQADIYFVTATHEWNPIIGFIIKMLLRKPLFYVVHDPKHHPGAPWNIRFTDYIFRKFPDGYMVHTPLAKADLVKNGYDPERVFWTPTGVFNLFKRWENKDTKQENTILFFGRIEPYKGLHNLQLIASQILDTLPSWKIVIAGSGSMDSDFFIHKHERLIIDNRFIPDQEVTGLMQRAKILVMPYTELTYSGVILTAFAFNIPVISTQIPNVAELVKHGQTGLLIPPDNPEELASAIIELAQNKNLHNYMSKQIPIFVEEYLNWRTCAEKCLRFFTNIISLG